MDKYDARVPGIGFPAALFIAFLVMKLCGVIAWSWSWVTAPLWVPLAVVFAALSMIFVAIIVVAVLHLVLGFDANR